MTSAPRSASVVVIAPGPSIEHSTIRTLARGAGGGRDRFGHGRTMMAHGLTPRQKRARLPSLDSVTNLTHECHSRARLLSCAGNHNLNVAIWLRTPVTLSQPKHAAFARPAAGAQCSADHPDPLRRAPRPSPPTPGGPPAMSGTDHPPSTNGPARSTSRSPGPVEQRRRRRGRRRPHQHRLGRQRTRRRGRRRARRHDRRPARGVAADAGPGRRLPGPRRHRDRRRGRGAPHHRGAHHHRAAPPPPRRRPRLPRRRRPSHRSRPARATTIRTTPPPGTASPSASPAATGPPTPATATTAASSSPWAPGGASAAPATPHQASRETQIAMGQRLWNQGGWSHWPACTQQARLPLAQRRAETSRTRR